MSLMRKIIKNRIGRIVVAGLAFTIGVLVVLSSVQGCGKAGSENDKLMVASDIVPLADFCRVIGGDRVEVVTIVPPGATPHTYELTSGQMRFLTEADVMVTNGLGLTPWAEDVFAKVENPGLVEVVAGEAVPQTELIAAVESEDGERGVYDPHTWLDPNLAIYIVEAVCDGFKKADPDNARYYSDSAEAYIEELKELDSEIGGITAAFSDRKFVSFHSSWTYFARRYGLEQVGVIEELPGKEPSVGEIADLVELIEAQGVKVVFVEPQFNPRAAEAIAEESGGGVTVVTLDPLGDPEDPDKNTYVKMIKGNVEAMGEVLR